MPTPRRRGAQPNNTNALKHGFYSQRFRRQELAGLDQLPDTDLTSEINLLRVMMSRILEQADTEELDLEALSATLNTLGSAATRIGSLMRTHAILNGDQSSDVAAALSSALSEVVKELNIK